MGALADTAAVALHSLSPPPDARRRRASNELVQRTGALAGALEEQLDALSPALDAAAPAVVDAALPDAAAAATDAAARLRTQADECRAALRASREAAAAGGDHAAHCLLSRTSSSSRRGACLAGRKSLRSLRRIPKITCRGCACHHPPFPASHLAMGESGACVMPVTFPEISTHLKFAWNVLGDRGAPLHQFDARVRPRRTRRPANNRDEAARELAGDER